MVPYSIRQSAVERGPLVTQRSFRDTTSLVLLATTWAHLNGQRGQVDGETWSEEAKALLRIAEPGDNTPRILYLFVFLGHVVLSH